VRRVVTYACWWVALFWLWFAYQGEWDRYEWVAAACGATAAAAFAALVARTGLLQFRLPAKALREGLSVPLQILVDCGILALALARRVVRRPVGGEFVDRPFPSRGTGPIAAGDRAARATLGTYSPNAYVVDLDPHSHRALLHDLVPNRDSERPA